MAGGGALPENVMARIRMGGTASEALALPGAGGALLQLSFLGRIGEDEFLFRLAAADHADEGQVLRGKFALTTREAEVLVWIGRGKSNRDIGEILGLSPRTVNKHLEQIYVKLGVENRASAAVLASRALDER